MARSDFDRNEGYEEKNYNCGLVDVTDRPYKYMVKAIKETAKSLYDVAFPEFWMPLYKKPLKSLWLMDQFLIYE